MAEKQTWGHTWSWIQQLFDNCEQKEVAYLDIKGTCHDCGGPVTMTIHRWNDGRVDIDGGGVLKVAERDVPFFKCPDCLDKDPVFRNYRPCEKYTRVVGYMRPVNQWNKGKKAEYAMRKNFDMSCATPE